MCKLAYIRTKDKSAYSRCIDMIHHQENVVAGHSTGFTFRKLDGSFSTRKTIGKINSYLAEYPDKPSSRECLGHSRYATVGAININNQHPISVMYKDRKIGYAIHNGRFDDYESWEQYRSSGIVNKTDSALLFSIFSKVLEKLGGDSKPNRRMAFSFIMNIIKTESNHNLIMMFKDGQVLFGGNVLTYNVTPSKVGIMTFGLKTPTEDRFVYEINGFEIKKYTHHIPNVDIKRKVKKQTQKKVSSYMNYLGGYC